MSKGPYVTRSFYLIISEDQLPFTSEPRKGFHSFRMANGSYFNSRARLPSSQALQKQYADLTITKIKELITAEARKLQQEWYRGIPQFFNRRSYGMYFRKRGYPTNRRPSRFYKQHRHFRRKRGRVPHDMENGPFIGPRSYLWDTQGHAIESKYTNRRQFPGRTSTGQLRRALIMMDLTELGCLLYVRPCYASTGRKVDYVNILMHGARQKRGHPYIPELDRRIKIPGRRKNVWRGIKQSYWLTWQHYFDIKVEAANERLYKRISDMLIQLKILEKQDITRIDKSRKIKNLPELEDEQRQRAAKYGPVTPSSPYNNTRKLWSQDGMYKRDPQAYYNKHNQRFDPYLPPTPPRKRGKI